MTHTTGRPAAMRGRQTLARADAERPMGHSLAVAGTKVSRAFALRQSRAGIACVEIQCRAFAKGEDQ